MGTVGILVASLLLVGGLYASMHRAHADVLLFIDGSTCEPALGGTWDGSTNTCTLPSLTLDSDTDLEVAFGVTVVIPGTSIVEIGDHRSFHVGSGSVLNIDDGSIIVLNNGTFTNSGTLNVINSGGSANDVIENYGTFTNSGTLNLSNSGGGRSGIRNLDTFTNSGTLTVSSTAGAAIFNALTFTNSGTVSVSNSGGEGINNFGGTITNSGTLTVSSTGTGNGISNISTIDNTNSGTLTVSSTGTGYGVSNFGTVQGSGVLINSGTLTVGDRGISSVDGGTINNSGTITVENGNSIGIENSAGFTNSGTLTIRNSGGTGISNQGGLVNSGTLNVSNSGGTGISNQSFLTNSGTINVGNTNGVGIDSFGTSGINVISGGIVNVLSGGTVNNSAAGSSHGTIMNIDSGGIVNVLSGGTLSNVAGGTISQTTIKINSGGIVNILSGATVINSGIIDIYTGTTHINPSGTLFVFCGGLLTNTGTVTGTITYENCIPASITLSPTSEPAGSQVTVTGAGFAATSAITIKFDGAALPTTPSPLTTNSNGEFSATITIPSNAGIGPHTITAEDASTNSAPAQFEVTVPPVVPLSPSKDSFLRQDKSNVNDGANPRLQVRQTDNKRTLIAFDQTDITQSSQGKTLQSATLKMFIIENSNSWGSSGRTIELHLLKTDWTEGNGKYTLDRFRGTGPGVTWNCPTDTNIANDNRDCSTRWTGGSFVSAVTVNKLITNGLTGQIDFDVTKDVKAFLAGTTKNFGWVIKKTQEDRSGHVFFASGEAAANQPVLELRYS
jgi:fibronectin-binding autotransporter adhesin